MTDFINFHEKNKLVKIFILNVIKISTVFSDKYFCRFWNFSLGIINNSVKIQPTSRNTFSVSDENYNIEIIYKDRFEYYLQNISARFDHLIYEYMFENIEFSNDDIIIDCGANIGEIYSSLMHHTNHELNFNYFGFEPHKRDFEVLSRNTINLVDQPLALSIDSQDRDFYLNPNTADSSFESRINAEKVVVKCTTLDNYFASYESIKLLKLEAEGFELDVLQGAQEILSNIKFITADLGYELENNTKRSFEEVNEYLGKNNFVNISSTPRETYLYRNLNN
tara:strand:- start:1606 stop:2445 length:840 start_codon:yes stop_codon:yes gene_type:complete